MFLPVEPIQDPDLVGSSPFEKSNPDRMEDGRPFLEHEDWIVKTDSKGVR